MPTDPTAIPPSAMDMDTLTVNVLTIVGELAAVVLVFVVLGLILRAMLKSVAGLPALRRFEPGVELVRRNLRVLLFLLCAVACLGVAGVNGWLMYRGEVLWEYSLERLRAVPRDVWIALAFAAGKVLGLVVLTAIVLRPVRTVLDALCRSAKAYEGIRANDESIERFFASLERIVGRAAWLYVLVLSTMLLGMPEAVSGWALVALRIYLIIAAGLLLWRAVDAVIASLDALSRKFSSPDNLLRFYDRLDHLIPLFRRSLEGIVYVLMAWAVVLQVELIASLAGWGPTLIRVIAIIFIARLLIALLSLVVEEGLITRPKLTPPQKQRRMTIVPLIQSVARYVVYFAAGIQILKEIGQDPTPILAGAGILGLAVGLGAQGLIKDIVSGFFILFDGYFLVGDFIRTGEAEGTVESITLRATSIRDPEGRVHIVRNGEFVDLVNYSKEYTRAAVNVGVAYDSDLDQVYAVLKEAGDVLASSNADVLEPPRVAGLDDFGESELTIRTVTKVRPGCHLQVARDFRKLIKERFDATGIEIPFARRVMIFHDGDGNEIDVSALVPASS